MNLGSLPHAWVSVQRILITAISSKIRAVLEWYQCTSGLLPWLQVPNMFKLDIKKEVYIELYSSIDVAYTVTRMHKRSRFLNVCDHFTQFIST